MNTEERNTLVSAVMPFLGKMMLIGIVAGLCWHYVLCVTAVTGEGMYPRLRDGDLAMVYRWGAVYHPGDVVVFIKEKEKYAGRVVAVAGDHVKIPVDSGLYVNQALQTEQIFYETRPDGDTGIEVDVPEDAYYILADFRTNAVDSRQLGCISEAEIIGKVSMIIRRRGI